MINSHLLQKVQYIKSVYPESFEDMSVIDVKGKIYLAFGCKEIDRDAKENSLYKAIRNCKEKDKEGTIVSDIERLEAISNENKAKLWDRIPNVLKKPLLLLLK